MRFETGVLIVETSAVVTYLIGDISLGMLVAFTAAMAFFVVTHRPDGGAGE